MDLVKYELLQSNNNYIQISAFYVNQPLHLFKIYISKIMYNLKHEISN